MSFNSADSSTAPASAAPSSGSADKVARFSISIPCELAAELDRLVEKRGFKNRSQAVAEMVLTELACQKEQVGTESMAGTLSLVYDYRRRNLQSTLSELQHTHYLKIVASMHVHLEQHHYLEVLLVQGPASQLRKMADDFATCKGVKSAKLQLTAFAIPPLL
ncbi:nickel-responsive transcriptional regulator NikR [Opitutaceae bacterium EW11]|nr:nickel-responsive transcriptional regulator NikR [Opitutaceae bacterium EW11]